MFDETDSLVRQKIRPENIYHNCSISKSLNIPDTRFSTVKCIENHEHTKRHSQFKISQKDIGNMLRIKRGHLCTHRTVRFRILFDTFSHECLQIAQIPSFGESPHKFAISKHFLTISCLHYEWRQSRFRK